MNHRILRILTVILSVSFGYNAYASFVEQNENNYTVSLKNLCYVELSKEFNQFANKLTDINIKQYKENIKKLGINKSGKNIDYTKAIPMADIMTTSDKLGFAIKQINRSLIKLNDVRKACSDELNKYIHKD